MSILGKRNVINKISKVLSLLLTQSEIITSAKTESKLHKSFEAEKAAQHPRSSTAMGRWCLGPSSSGPASAGSDRCWWTSTVLIPPCSACFPLGREVLSEDRALMDLAACCLPAGCVQREQSFLAPALRCLGRSGPESRNAGREAKHPRDPLQWGHGAALQPQSQQH